MTATTKSLTGPPTTGARARNQRYRARNRRIDYIPSAAALAAITTWEARKLDNCTAGVLDKLLLAGHQALTAQQPVSGDSGR